MPLTDEDIQVLIKMCILSKWERFKLWVKLKLDIKPKFIGKHLCIWWNDDFPMWDNWDNAPIRTYKTSYFLKSTEITIESYEPSMN
jgi:hypothetical protein